MVGMCGGGPLRDYLMYQSSRPTGGHLAGPANGPMSHAVSHSSASSSNLAPLRLKPNEIEFFTNMFDALDTKKNGRATGKQVSKLFVHSRLPKNVLAEIWNIASQGKPGALSKSSFFVACRLVAIAQQNLPVNKASLVKFIDVPLPNFGAIAERFMPSESTASQPALINPPEMDRAPSVQDNLPRISRQGSMTDSAGTFWSISEDEIQKLLTYFDQADTDQDGVVNGKEAQEFFKQSGLSGTILRDIWVLSDVNRDNKLSKMEFVVAMHLIMKVRVDKVPLPGTLPRELAELAKRTREIPIASEPVMKELPGPPQKSLRGPDEMKLDPDQALGSLPTGDGASYSMGPMMMAPVSMSRPTQTQPSMMMPSQSTQYDQFGFQQQQQPQQQAYFQAQAPPQSTAPIADPLDNMRAEAENLRQKVDAMTLEGDRHKHQVEKFKREQNELSERIEFYNTQLEALQIQHGEYENMIMETQTQIELEKSKLHEVQNQIHRMKLAIDDRKGQVSEERRRIDDYRARQEYLEQQRTDIDQMVNDEDLLVSMTQQEIESIERHLQQVMELIEDQKTTLESRRNQKGDLDKEKVALKRRLRNAMQEMKNQQEESKTLSTTLRDDMSEVTRLRSDVNEAESSVSQARRDLDTSRRVQRDILPAAVVDVSKLGIVDVQALDEQKAAIEAPDVVAEKPIDDVLAEEWPELDDDIFGIDSTNNSVTVPAPAPARVSSVTPLSFEDDAQSGSQLNSPDEDEGYGSDEEFDAAFSFGNESKSSRSKANSDANPFDNLAVGAVSVRKSAPKAAEFNIDAGDEDTFNFDDPAARSDSFDFTEENILAANEAEKPKDDDEFNFSGDDFDFGAADDGGFNFDANDDPFDVNEDFPEFGLEDDEEQPGEGAFDFSGQGDIVSDRFDISSAPIPRSNNGSTSTPTRREPTMELFEIADNGNAFSFGDDKNGDADWDF